MLNWSNVARNVVLVMFEARNFHGGDWPVAFFW